MTGESFTNVNITRILGYTRRRAWQSDIRVRMRSSWIPLRCQISSHLFCPVCDIEVIDGPVEESECRDS